MHCVNTAKRVTTGEPFQALNAEGEFPQGQGAFCGEATFPPP